MRASAWLSLNPWAFRPAILKIISPNSYHRLLVFVFMFYYTFSIPLFQFLVNDYHLWNLIAHLGCFFFWVFFSKPMITSHPEYMNLIVVCCFVLFQTDVPNFESVVHRDKARTEIRSSHGHRPRRQQTISLRLSQVFVAGGRKSWSSGSLQAVHASRFAVYGRSAPEASCLLRESQVN